MSRWPPIPAMEKEVLFLPQNHLIENAKIGIGSRSIQTPEGFQIGSFQDLGQKEKCCKPES